MNFLNLTSIKFLERNTDYDGDDKLSVFLNKLPKEVKQYIFYTYVYPDMLYIRYNEIIIHVESNYCRDLTTEGYAKLSQLLESIIFDKTYRPLIQKLCDNHSEFKTSYNSHISGYKGFVNFPRITSLALSWMFYLYH